MAVSRPVLKAETRKVTGRKVKNLRAQGLIPVSLYGKDVKSSSLQIDGKEIAKILEKVGEASLLDLVIDGSKEPKVVLIKNSQFDPITDRLIHVDFHQVKLTEKVTVSIPVELAGESPVVARSEGILVQILDEVEIEALPMDLPEKFVLDISKLEKIGDTATVADLKIDGKTITSKIAADQVLVKIDSPTVEESEPVASAEAEGTPVEGEVPAEGEAKSTEEPKDKAEEKSAE